MPIPIPISRTKIATVPWGIPVTNEINRLTTQSDSNTSRVTALEAKVADSGWLTMTLLSGWIPNQSGVVAQYRKVGDRVYLRGDIKSGSSPGAIWNVPAGYRPPAGRHCAWAVNAGNALGILSLDASANVLQISNGSNAYLYLDPCSWSTV